MTMRSFSVLTMKFIELFLLYISMKLWTDFIIIILMWLIYFILILLSLSGRYESRVLNILR